jgi:hypothetical protein
LQGPRKPIAWLVPRAPIAYSLQPAAGIGSGADPAEPQASPQAVIPGQIGRY